LRFWYWNDFYFTTCVCHPPPAPPQGEPKGLRDTRICQYTGQRHTILSGIKDKDFATRLGSAYPAQLCTELARSFDRLATRNRIRGINHFMSGMRHDASQQAAAAAERGRPKEPIASGRPKGAAFRQAVADRMKQLSSWE
jgi:hypothetical protein